jgi:GH35 family endo-1,4-beta-xylanase
MGQKERWMRWAASGISCFVAMFVLGMAFVPLVHAPTTINGGSLSHRSSGSGFSNWTLSENGYVGTYFRLDQAGPVTLTVNASGATNDAVVPRMNLVVADTKAGFDVAGGFNSYQHTFDLPAGTYFLRTEFANDVPTANRQLTVGSLTISGATAVSNTNNTTTNSANALAAADSYIENYRKGPAQLTVVGAEPGTMVHARLKRHDFRFGTAVGGTFVGGGGNPFDVNTYLNNPNYSNYLRSHFNTVTQGNAGKWASNEATRDVVTMQAVDRIIQYAVDNNLDVRLHNMLWADSQQPNWVNTLLNNAAGGNQAAKNDLRAEISERIDYYVGNADGNPLNDRARLYHEMDLINEHSHQPKYWNVYGADGVADIFNEAATAVAAANSSAKLYLNEYNVFAWGDAYGNWYRRDVEEIVDHGGAIGGIGIQYYPSATNHNAAVHSPARMNQVLQGLSVTGLDISLTEFGVSTADGTTLQNAATYLEDTMRLIFGTPNATTFMMWGFWANDVWNQAPLAALMDANWNITLPGLTYQALMNEWTTDVMLPVGPDGTIDFSGFYGQYEVTIGGQTFNLDLTKGQSLYSLVLAPGDYNGDGVVDAADYTLWRNALATNDLRADGNGDLVIDEADYAVWKAAYGTTYSVGSGGLPSLVVPEPASGVTLALTMLLSAVIAWRSRGYRWSTR